MCIYLIQKIKYFVIQFKVVGRELSIALAFHLLKYYKKESFFKTLIDSIDFHILHSMNPDGFEIATEGQCLGEEIGSGRQNANDVSKKKTKKF